MDKCLPSEKNMSVLQAIKTALFGDGALARQNNIRALAARYNIGNKRNPGDTQRRFLACRIDSITLQMVTLTAPVIGEIGEKIVVQSDEFGELSGPIVQEVNSGFKFKIEATDEERGRLAAKLKWLKKNINQRLPDKREHKRIVPHEPLSALILPDGRTPTCFVIDMSSWGAAVSADITPEIGAPLAVGRIIGRVVRHLPNGFAIRFLREIDLSVLEQQLIKSPKKQQPAFRLTLQVDHSVRADQ
jgi:hypothetical protein